jgi:hypothetical protein
MAGKEKKEWKSPQLTIFGSVEDITKTTVKYLNSNDGFVLGSPQGPTIGYS